MGGKTKAALWRGEAQPRPEGRLRLVAAALGAGCETTAPNEVWRLDPTVMLLLRIYYMKMYLNP